MASSVESSLAPPTARVSTLARCGVFVALVCLAGCGKGIAGGLAPDFAGLWDVTYDDSIEVEFTLGEQQISARVDEVGGQVSVRDAGVALDLEIDCTRPELVCPSEVWPRELTLKKAPGKVDREGVQLAQPMAGAGFGRCTSKPGSNVTGEVMSVATAHSIRPEAVALTAGRISVVLDASCFAPHAGLPAGTLVTLAAGYTATKR
ncbi:MAG: hypothetical protein RLZZ450_3794 [Pseudomonadota bacterium]|jgi:hypothetical protein